MSSSLSHRYDSLSILLTVLCSLVLLVIGAEPVTSATSFKKIQTKTFGLEIPDNWKIQDSAAEWAAYGPDKSDSPVVSVRSAKVDGTLADYVKSYRKEMEGSPNQSTILGEKSAQVAGLPAKIVDAQGPCVSMPEGSYTCRSRCWLLLHKQRGYQIMVAANADLTKYEPTFVHVVKSFTPQ